jgi:phosphatidylinositol glycan class W
MAGPDTTFDNMTTTQSYKQLKEEFVSNLSGGSVAEIAQVCAVAPV